jgi:TPP-dependent indolepyruvate ferredoxin oxidoreductase alpha subunit
MSFDLYIDDTCPKCRKPVKIVSIEPHPTRRELALHNFKCVDCGRVKTKVFSVKPSETTLELAART